jgi:hypothetical protein
MSNDPNRSRLDRKPDFPEFWSRAFYHRIVRATIARELGASFELSKELPHRMVVLLAQLRQGSDKK